MNNKYILYISLLLAIALTSVKAQYTDVVLNSPIPADKPVKVIATNSITLDDGFEVPVDGNFFADTDPDFLDYKEPEPDNTNNYIHIRKPNTRLPDLSNLANLKASELHDQLQYFDGLGRSLQTVQPYASPVRNDIVQPVFYDNYGRETEIYLPYTIKADTENFRTSPKAEQPAFYQNTMGFTEDYDFAYTKKTFDNSPLNRLIELASPGKDWHEGGNTVRYTYAANVLNEVRFIEPVIDANGTVTSVKLNNKYYGANQLFKTITTDENNNETIEFKDKQGNVVMKYAKPDASTKAYTYYVYDEMNLLRAVIPPKAVKLIDDLNPEPATLEVSNTIMSELCYIYNYDSLNRMTEKKLPGAEPVYMIYDKRDRLVAAQDGNQRDVSTVYDEWTFTRYDALNRPILTGIYKWDKGRTRADLQNAANSYTGTNLYEETDGNIHGYTNRSFPGARYNNTGPIDENDVLTVTYYDNYSNTSYTYANPNRSQLDAELIGFETTNSSNVKGMATITKTKVLNPTTGMTNTWLEEVVFYDEKSRPIQTITENAWGGYDRISTKYSFAGQVFATIQEHKRTTGSSLTYIAKLFTYDHAGRLLTTQQVIEDDATNGKVTIAANMYDELGQLTTKSLHNRAQNVDYNYNIRGWLTGINNPFNMGSDLFAMNLGYEKDMEGNATPQYNGNISHVIWRYTGNILAGCYAYEYDELNRLILANHLDYTDANGFVADNEYDVEGIMYDLNGNIENLTRYADNGDGKIDDLSYNYSGNKLIGVEDVALSGRGGFEEFSMEGDGSDHANESTWEYSYDDNGNMIADKNKNIKLTYNHLNLPKIIESDGNSDEIEYIYTASGTKIAKEVYQSGATTTRHYIGNIEYNGTTLDIMHFEEGYVDLATNTYHYYLKDHLGNTRIVFKTNGGDAQVVQKNDYYPFGMDMYSWSSGTENKYKYNGKELQDEALDGVNLDWYDFGARMYDPALGRWHNIDAFTEIKYNWTPYRYGYNNPLRFVDPDGTTEEERVKAIFRARQFVDKNNIPPVEEGHHPLYRDPTVDITGKPGWPTDCSGLVNEGSIYSGYGSLNIDARDRYIKVDIPYRPVIAEFQTGVKNIINQSNTREITLNEIRPGDIFSIDNEGHTGYIEKIFYDENGNVESYTILHSRGKAGPIRTFIDVNMSMEKRKNFDDWYAAYYFNDGKAKFYAWDTKDATEISTVSTFYNRLQLYEESYQAAMLEFMRVLNEQSKRLRQMWEEY